MEGEGTQASESGSVTPTQSAAERRAPLLGAMAALGNQNIGCANCSGVCCTAIANSMQVTPVELFDVVELLQERQAFTPALKQGLQDCVRKYRLDVEVGHGRRTLRKTYTCPFYTPGPTGCGLNRTHKPYGCLAFNARKPHVTEGEDCGSDSDQLQAREDLFETEERDNERLRVAWKLYWEKAPLPLALLEVWDRVTDG